MKIEKDTSHRGTQDCPVYVVWLRYGRLPAVEIQLDARTMAQAKIEVARRWLPKND